jgi:DNA-binding NtrC family response regulator
MKVLIVDDDPAVASYCMAVLVRMGHQTASVRSGREALDALGGGRFDAIVSDIRMPGMDGLELLRSIRSGERPPAVVLMTGFASIGSAVEAMRLGAFDYLLKPFETSQLEATMRRLAGQRARRNPGLSSAGVELDAHGIVGNSAPVREMLRAVERLAGKQEPVLIAGETGAGKELTARAIHASGPRRELPFVTVDCGSIEADGFGSELFGHVAGAFAGAIRDRAGLLSAAGGGTLLLDEVADLPLPLQGRFLRVIESGDFRPLGSDDAKRFDGRVLASTTRDLEAAVAAGAFRAELYFRLCVHTIAVPPLRARKDDIPLLLREFLARHGGEDLEIPPEVLAELATYDWPGNVRELDNCAAGMLGSLKDGRIERDSIPHALRAAFHRGPESGLTPLESAERDAILEALQATAGNVSAAARRLRISKATIYRKMKAHHVLPPRQ